VIALILRNFTSVYIPKDLITKNTAPKFEIDKKYTTNHSIYVVWNFVRWWEESSRVESSRVERMVKCSHNINIRICREYGLVFKASLNQSVFSIGDIIPIEIYVLFLLLFHTILSISCLNNGTHSLWNLYKRLRIIRERKHILWNVRCIVSWRLTYATDNITTIQVQKRNAYLSKFFSLLITYETHIKHTHTHTKHTKHTKHTLNKWSSLFYSNPKL
jgi:hypothetical protein